MTKVPQKKSPQLKFQLAVEAIKGEKTITQIASDNGIHPRQLIRWRDQLLEEGDQLFIHKGTQKSREPDKDKLIHVINQLTAELEFIKKKLRTGD